MHNNKYKRSLRFRVSPQLCFCFTLRRRRPFLVFAAQRLQNDGRVNLLGNLRYLFRVYIFWAIFSYADGGRVPPISVCNVSEMLGVL